MQCDGPQPGIYHIINSQLSSFGNQLAANDVGANYPLIVSKASGFTSQKWMVSGSPGSPQTIAPMSQPGYEAGPAGNYVEPLLAGNYKWCMTPRNPDKMPGEPGNIYFIIMEPQTRRVWGINRAAEGQQIMLEMDNKSQLQIWEFIPA